MSKKLSLLLLLALPLSAAELYYSTSEISIGPNQRAGVLTLVIDSDEFLTASEITPIILRLSLQQNCVVLDNTLTFAGAPAINLLPRLDGGLGSVSLAMPEGAVTLSRFVKGENSFYIKINYPTSRWLLVDGGGFISPSKTLKVSFCIGMTYENGADYGFANTCGGDPMDTPIFLNVKQAPLDGRVQLGFCAFASGSNIDPPKNDTFWPEAFVEGVLPISTYEMADIARVRCCIDPIWFGF